MNSDIKKLPVGPLGLPVTDIIKENAQFPGLCATPAGEVRVHWQSYANQHDTLRTGRLCGEELCGVQDISGPGEVLYPVCLAHGDAVWYAWSEAQNGLWALCLRRLSGGAFGPILTVETGDALLYPRLFAHKGEVQLLYTRQTRGAAQAVLCPVTEAGVGPAEVVSLCREAYRACGCEGGDGNLYIAYDCGEDHAYNVVARVKTESGWSGEVRVDQNDDWTSSPCIMPTPTGATVCWYTFGYGATFGVFSADLSAEGGSLCAALPQTITKNTGWYLNLTCAGGPAGLQIIAYTWGKSNVQVRYRRGDGPWSEPALLSYDDVHCAVHPSLWVEADDTVVMAWQFAMKNGHFDRNAQIVLTRFTPATIDEKADASREVAENTFCQPIPAPKELSAHSPQEVAAWLAKNGYSGQLLFGDIHGQSGISDGMAEIDQYYHRACDKPNLDFVALTDHDCYPDWISQSEWELMRTTNRLMNTDGKLSCILAFEWTPNEYKHDYGHKNVYYRGDEGDIFRSGDADGKSPTDLYAAIKRYRAFCVPHHPAADWGHVSAATDWNFYDADVQRLAEIMSRHAPYEDDESQSKYTKNIKKFPRHSVQEALARGYRMGFTAGSDSHQMEHGVEGGIVAVYTPAHTREDIWDSLFARQSYGTTGARILVSLKANGAMMGSEITAPQGQAVQFAISVLGTAPVKVELVKNNEVVQAWQPGGNAVDATLEDGARSTSDYYYLRVTQTDDHMAWSSPIWVDAQ